MGNLFRALSRAFLALFPFLELIFLGLYLGSFFGSASTIVILIALLISSYFVDRFTRPIAWGILGFIIVSSYDGIVQAVIAAVIFGGIRFLFSMVVKAFK